MSHPLNIPTSSKKKIYGTHRGEYSWPTVIFVHGLTSSSLESKYYNAARLFEKHKIATVRYNLYSWEHDARKLHTSSMKDQGHDIDVLCSYVRKKGSSHIVVVGHSMGALCIVHANQTGFDQVIFWDGSHNITKYLEGPDVPKFDAVLLDCGFGALLSKKMLKEVSLMDYEKKVSELDVPLTLIYAGDGELLNGMKAYQSVAKNATSHVVKGAGHNFDEGETEVELLQLTLEAVEGEMKKNGK